MAPHTVLAGGTDYYPAGSASPATGILDITAIAELRGIAERTTTGASARDHWSALAARSRCRLFDGLKLAAREVGGVQIQNAGTVGGNLCNASPAADGVPPLLALDADVELSSASGVRRCRSRISSSATARTRAGAGRTADRDPVPKPDAARGRSHFVKLGARRYLVISIVMVGGDARVARRPGRACARRGRRLLAGGAATAGAEAALLGAPLRPGRRAGEAASTRRRSRRSTTCAPAPTTASMPR